LNKEKTLKMEYNPLSEKILRKKIKIIIKNHIDKMDKEADRILERKQYEIERLLEREQYEIERMLERKQYEIERYLERRSEL
jgi:cell division septum initiation protein DivIVA